LAGIALPAQGGTQARRYLGNGDWQPRDPSSFKPAFRVGRSRRASNRQKPDLDDVHRATRRDAR